MEWDDLDGEGSEQHGDDVVDTEREVVCPYCAEHVELTLDPGGGAEQEYVEDCPVCCQPWRVLVSYDREGWARVHLERANS